MNIIHVIVTQDSEYYDIHNVNLNDNHEFNDIVIHNDDNGMMIIFESYHDSKIHSNIYINYNPINGSHDYTYTVYE